MPLGNDRPSLLVSMYSFFDNALLLSLDIYI